MGCRATLNFRKFKVALNPETSNFFRRISLPVGGNRNKLWRSDQKSKYGFLDTHRVATSWTNGFLLMLQMFWKIIQLWNMKDSTLSPQSCLLHKPFSVYTRKFALWERTTTTSGPATKGIVANQNDIQHLWQSDKLHRQTNSNMQTRFKMQTDKKNCFFSSGTW